MPNRDQLKAWFTYHPPNSTQQEAYEQLRDRGLALAEAINEQCPDSLDKDEAIRKVREAVMTANAAIACAPFLGKGATASSRG